MHWQVQPIIWIVLIATLALLAIPRPGYPQEASVTVRKACNLDVRRLCPKEFMLKDSALIGECMRVHAASIGARCMKAWMLEHQGR